MARPRVPLTTFEREKLRSARIWGLVVGALGIGLVALALSAGQEKTALLVLLVVATYIGGIWSVALRVPWLTALLLSAAAVATGVLAGYPFIGAIAGVALFGWLAFQSGVPPSLTPESLRALEPDAVDPEAVPAVEAFEALGFTRVGAYGFEPIPGKTVVATVLVGAASDQYAVVTDLVLDVVSSFGERLLVTRNSASTPLPPAWLGNDLRGAKPSELADGHRRALELLATRGLTPNRIPGDRVLEMQLAIERRTLEWVQSHSGRTKVTSFFGSGAGSGALDDGTSSRRRIDGWLAAPSPAL